MTTEDSEATPRRDSAHDALSVFLGDWRAEGMSFGGTDQSGANPKANGVPWISTHNARWHIGHLVSGQKPARKAQKRRTRWRTKPHRR